MNAMVILVNAPIRLLAGSRDVRPPLGLLYIASIVQEMGLPLKYFDLQLPEITWAMVEEAVGGYDKCLVGFTCDSDNFLRVIRLSDRLTSRYPHVTSVIGGPHATTAPDSCVGARRIVVRGEGEYPMRRLAEYFFCGRGTLAEVPSISYLADGTIQHNPISYGPYEDINCIPLPSRSLLPKNLPFSHTIVTARGCVYNCHFCSEGRSNHTYRPRSIANIKEELLEIQRINRSDKLYISFSDDTFTCSARQVKGMCDLLNELFPDKSKFGFFCEARVNVLAKYPDLMTSLKESGLRRMQIGIESGSPDLLKKMNKQIRTDEIREVIRQAVAADISTIFGVFICGLPGQTEEDVRNDIAFAKQLLELAEGRLELRMSLLTPLPATEFHDNASEWGITLDDANYVTGYITEDCFTHTAHLNKEQMVELHGTFERIINGYSLRQTERMNTRKVRDAFILAGDFGVIPLPVRQLCKAAHANWVLLLRSRADHRFACEIPAADLIDCCPVRVPNEITQRNGSCIVNQGSMRAFKLPAQDMAYFEHFTGKLSFKEVAAKLSREKSIDLDSAIENCFRVYHACEDNLASLILVQ